MRRATSPGSPMTRPKQSEKFKIHLNNVIIKLAMADNKINNKLKQLPAQPGVYFHKSKTGEIIYVGKADGFKKPC